MHPPKLVDLFCGCGGMSLGAARAGFKIALAVDNDARALNSHQQNFPEVEHLKADLSHSTGEELLLAAKLKGGEIDVVIGGPPCQGFSVIGKRRIEDERNQLVVH